MASFTFQVRNPSGATKTGTVQAGSIGEATQIIRRRGQYLLHIAAVSSTGPVDLLDRLRSISFEMGPGLKDILNFTNQLAVMIRAGINIRSALGGIAEQIQNKKFRGMIEQIKADVEAGETLSNALGKHPKAFQPLYVNMVRASELSGNLGQMLSRISEYLEQQMETRSMVRGALIYPAIIGTMAIITTVFLLTFVLPRFMKIFEGKHDLLPTPTKMLLAISSAMCNYWYILITALVALGWGFHAAIQTPAGRLLFDKFKLRMPIFKRMFRALYISRGLHTMGELVNAGVPMLNTLKITSEISGNLIYENMWRQVYTEVKQGEKIATPLRRLGQLPPSVVQMVSAGEESGNLGEVLRDVSKFYANELRNTIKTVTAMIEPLMIVIMGVLVGFIAMSIILPIFGMSQLVK